ncbi:MAG TPA: DEAD/DEAH box helicase [Trebonia sp.]|nr:DEAD/DEAH box helicase [Trebonia sp.]
MYTLTDDSVPGTDEDHIALEVLRAAQRARELVHLKHIPGREGQTTSWPPSVRPDIADALASCGIVAPWTHQSLAASLARSGRHVILATRAASGKSAGYLAAALSEILDGGTALYLAPTKALAADQLRSVRALSVPGVRAAAFDGDSTAAERSWAQAHANYLLTNPDMLHSGILPAHARWRGFFKRLRVVIVDECHGYRGVFGAHVAQVLRRLRRVAAHYAPSGPGPSGPVFILASATITDPAACARLLTGLDAVPVTADGSPRPPLTFALWEPPPLHTRPGERARRAVTSEAAELLAGLVKAGVPSLAFTRSRRGAETVSLSARSLSKVAGAVAAYRSGYLPDDRRQLEADLRDGRITGMASTTALELGVNITGLDAVLIAGWPGTWASLWQQAGRAGRAGRPAIAVFIAGDDPLDTYLVHHPDVLLGHPVEPAVLDPDNPYVLGPHLVAAAAEAPLTSADLDLFGPVAARATERLTTEGELRRRESGWYPARHGHPARSISLRGNAAAPIRVVEEGTGRLIGTMDEPSAHRFVHDDAVYLHQGETYVVRALELDDRVALVECRDPGYTTQVRDITEIDVTTERRRVSWGDATVAFGDVRVTRRVTGYTKVRSGVKIGGADLSLPARTLATRAVWWSVPRAGDLGDLGNPGDLAGAAHAAEHASIGLLPLFATCDRWDVGGLSAARHPATGQVSVFVYDGHEGGAGFAERGFAAATEWLRATRDAIAACPCEAGCPTCVHSPRCGRGNSPLSKAGAVALLGCLVSGAPLTTRNGMLRGQLIKITNRSRSGLSLARVSTYKSATDSRNVRVRQPGTHARPAAGGVSGQVKPVEGSRREKASGARRVCLTDKKGARFGSQVAGLTATAPPAGAPFACPRCPFAVPSPRGAVPSRCRPVAVLPLPVPSPRGTVRLEVGTRKPVVAGRARACLLGPDGGARLWLGGLRRGLTLG